MAPTGKSEYLTELQFCDELDILKKAKRSSGMSYETLADKIGVNKVWLASVFEGQQWVPEEYCRRIAKSLGVPEDSTKFLSNHPYKGSSDQILYCLHEALDTFGPAIQNIIHEQGGNSLMSAIDFGLDCDVVEDANGTHHLIIKFDGKLLSHPKNSQYPW